MRYKLNKSGGKGDTFRDLDKEKYDKEIERLYGDYCRLSHQHDKDCKLKEDKSVPKD